MRPDSRGGPRSSGTRQSTPTTSAPAVGHEIEQLAGADPEEDARDPEVARRPRGPGAVAGRAKRLVVGARQRPRPAVEELDRARPGLDLAAQRGERDLGEPVERAANQVSGSACISALGPGEVTGRPALDEVARHA